MGAKIDKLLRKASRMYAFRQVNKKLAGQPINDVNTGVDRKMLEREYELAVKKMQFAWDNSSDRGREILKRQWVAMVREGDKKPMVQQAAIPWPPNSTNLIR